MWPRTEEEKARRRNCGFVSFIKRAAAEEAKDDLDGYELNGMMMTVGWGKAVKIFPIPVVVNEPPVPSITRGGNWDVPSSAVAINNTSAVQLPSSTDIFSKETHKHVEVRIPMDRRRKELIDLMASFVATDGEAFEQVRDRVYCLHIRVRLFVFCFFKLWTIEERKE